MREWFNRLPWKGSNWVTGSRVRIPLSPPIFKRKNRVEISKFRRRYITQVLVKIARSLF